MQDRILADAGEKGCKAFFAERKQRDVAGEKRAKGAWPTRHNRNSYARVIMISIRVRKHSIYHHESLYRTLDFHR